MKKNHAVKEPYSRYISFRITDEMYDILKKAAEQKHLSLALYCRQIALISATKDLKNSN